MTAKNDSATVRAASSALRKEVDRLDLKMKEDLELLKHELVPLLLATSVLTARPEYRWNWTAGRMKSGRHLRDRTSVSKCVMVSIKDNLWFIS
jgi:hypothetical protein